MTPLSWEGWADRFSKAGYQVTAPAWPGRDDDVAGQRSRHPDPARGKLRLADVVAHFEAAVRALATPPVLIGHSMGGLVVQLLLQRGLGAKGVAIHSQAPKGIVTVSWPFIKSNWSVVSPFRRAAEPFLMSFEEFQYAWVHTLPVALQREAYDRYVVPESRLVARDSLGAEGLVDFTKERPPLLLTAGSEDHVIPAQLNRKNHAAYARGPSRTDWREFAGRTHFVLGQPGWEEVADHVRGWIEGH